MRRRVTARPTTSCSRAFAGRSRRHAATTFIVGFPGRTEQDVTGAVDSFATQASITSASHHRTRKAAARADDDVPADVKAARRDAVMKLQKAISRKKHKALRGRVACHG
jgi:tRNA A37 methylthiotransferase MiaB